MEPSDTKSDPSLEKSIENLDPKLEILLERSTLAGFHANKLIMHMNLHG
jgi:hypothetical protein